MEDFDKFLATLQKLPLAPSALPEYRDALAIKRILSGETPEAIAAATGRPAKWLTRRAEEIRARGLAGLIPHLAERLTRPAPERRRQGIAQMLLGTLTERRFEQFSHEITRGRQLSIEGRVAERTDTDYLVNDASGRPLCRLNIKFHGTLFRQAREMVGLDPNDCFALATYKIFNALQRQQQDRFPYVFLILSIPGLSASAVAPSVPDDFVWVMSVVKGRRVVEEAIAKELGRPEHADVFQGILNRMTEGEFRLISARRAFALLRDLLFERVFAVRVPRFNQNYRNAEIDMHFSISQELTPVATFLEILDRDSLQVLAVRLDRGEI